MRGRRPVAQVAHARLQAAEAAVRDRQRADAEADDLQARPLAPKDVRLRLVEAAEAVRDRRPVQQVLREVREAEAQPGARTNRDDGRAGPERRLEARVEPPPAQVG